MPLDVQIDLLIQRRAAPAGDLARWIGASRAPAHGGTALQAADAEDICRAVHESRRHANLWNFAAEREMTAIHLVTAEAGPARRRAIVRDLVRSLLPSLNRETAAMLRQSGAGASLGVTT